MLEVAPDRSRLTQFEDLSAHGAARCTDGKVQASQEGRVYIRVPANMPNANPSAATAARMAKRAKKKGRLARTTQQLYARNLRKKEQEEREAWYDGPPCNSHS